MRCHWKGFFEQVSDMVYSNFVKTLKNMWVFQQLWLPEYYIMCVRRWLLWNIEVLYLRYLHVNAIMGSKNTPCLVISSLTEYEWYTDPTHTEIISDIYAL